MSDSQTIDFDVLNDIARLLTHVPDSLPLVYPQWFTAPISKDPNDPLGTEALQLLSPLLKERLVNLNDPRWASFLNHCTKLTINNPTSLEISNAQLALKVLSHPTPLSDEERRKVRSIKLAKTSFNEAEFKNLEESTICFIKFAAQQLGLWVADRVDPFQAKGAVLAAVYYAMYFPIIQGSMMGKSRMVSEVAKTLCMTIYVNLSISTNVYPPPNGIIREWILVNSAVNLGRVADLNMQAFILACMQQAVDWLRHARQSRVAQEQGKPLDSVVYKDHGELFKAWKKLTAAPEVGDMGKPAEFWITVIERQQREAFDLNIAGRIQALGEIQPGMFQAPEVQAAMHVLEQLQFGAKLSVVPPGISESLWNAIDESTTGWFSGFVRHYIERIKFLSTEVDTLLFSLQDGVFHKETDLMRCRSVNEARWSEENPGRKFHWPNLMFVFDESRTLLAKDESSGIIIDRDTKQRTIFHTIRQLPRYFPRDPSSPIMVVIDTNARLSNFAPAGLIPDSARELNDSQYVGKTLFPPFWDIKAIDVHQVDMTKLGGSLFLDGYSGFGRAAWKTFRESISKTKPLSGGQKAEITDYLLLLVAKLCAKHPDKPYTDAALVSILSTQVCFAVHAYSPLAIECLASHMQKCTGVSENRHAIFLRTVPEPTLAIAGIIALGQVGWLQIFDKLNDRGVVDINIGANGEVAAQCLLIMLFNKFATKNRMLDDYPILPVSLFDLLSQLGIAESGAPNISGIEHFRAWTPFLKRAYVRVVQFTKSYSEMTPQFLRGRFCRSNGIICRPGATGVDGFLPLLISDKELVDLKDFEDAELTSLSHVGLQFKCRASFPGAAQYEKWATEAMEADVVLGPAAHSRDRDLPYVSLVLDVADNERELPSIWFFQSDRGRQLSIAIRGLRPSHILNDLGRERAAELNCSFHRFASQADDPFKDCEDDLSHSQADLYLESRDKYIRENKQGLVRRYHALVSAWTMKQSTMQFTTMKPMVDPLLASCNEILRSKKPFGLRQFESLFRNVASLEDYVAEAKGEPLLKKPRI